MFLLWVCQRETHLNPNLKACFANINSTYSIYLENIFQTYKRWAFFVQLLSLNPKLAGKSLPIQNRGLQLPNKLWHLCLCYLRKKICYLHRDGRYLVLKGQRSWCGSAHRLRSQWSSDPSPCRTGHRSASRPSRLCRQSSSSRRKRSYSPCTAE